MSAIESENVTKEASDQKIEQKKEVKKKKKSFFPEDRMDYKPIFREFEKEGGRVDTKWNKSAFLWGAIWPFVKGMWAYSIIYLSFFLITNLLIDPAVASIVVIPILWIFNGMYGNYMYYKFRTTRLQLEQTVITRLFALYFFILSILVFLKVPDAKEFLALLYAIIGVISLFASMVGIVMSNANSKEWKKIKIDDI